MHFNHFNEDLIFCRDLALPFNPKHKNLWGLFATGCRCYVEVEVSIFIFTLWVSQEGLLCFWATPRIRLALAMCLLIDVLKDTQAWLSLPVNPVLLSGANLIDSLLVSPRLSVGGESYVLWVVILSSREVTFRSPNLNIACSTATSLSPLIIKVAFLSYFCI